MTSHRTRILVFTLTPPLPIGSGGPAYVMNAIAPLADRYDYHLFTIGSQQDRERVAEHESLYRQYFKSVHIEDRPRIPAEKSFPAKVTHSLTHLWYGLPFIDLSYFSRAALAHARQIIEREQIDVLEIHTAHLAYFKRFFPEIPALLVGHNIESDLFPFWIPDALSPIEKLLMSRLARHSRRNAHSVEIENAWGFEAMTFISREDMARVSARVDKHYLPLCFPIQEDAYDARPDDYCDMLWMGGFGWYPNAEGVLWFVREVFPLISARLEQARIRLHFLGGSPPDELRAIDDGKHVFVHGFMPSIDQLLKSVHLLIVPLLSGGGVRVKILEAMSQGIPVLSTTKGCEGLGAQDGRDILIRDQPQAFADALLSLAGDRELRKRLAENARALLRERYDLNRCIEIKEGQYRRLVERPVKAARE